MSKALLSAREVTIMGCNFGLELDTILLALILLVVILIYFAL